MHKKIQLIILGYAGNEASNFNILQPYLGANVICSAIEYKGRGSRRKEDFYCSCDEMVKDIAEQVEKNRLPEYPYAILGYSMGAQNVYELFAQKLLGELPVHVFVAAHEPPDVACMAKQFRIEDNKEFIDHVKVYGGLDERLLADPRFAGIYIPRMKADFKLLQEYCFAGKYHNFPADLTVLYCEKDTPFSLIRGWERFAVKEPAFYELGHSHFFFRTNTEEFCGILLKELRMENKREDAEYE